MQGLLTQVINDGTPFWCAGFYLRFPNLIQTLDVNAIKRCWSIISFSEEKGKTWDSLSRLTSYMGTLLTQRSPGHAVCEKINLPKAKLPPWGPMAEQSKVQGVPRALDKQLPLPLPSCRGHLYLLKAGTGWQTRILLKSQFIRSFLQGIVLQEQFFMPLHL